MNIMIYIVLIGLSFFNIGSGTGYLSSLVGLLLGPYGTNHGIDIFQEIIDYSNQKVEEFIRFSDGFDPIKFCRPIFMLGNLECFDMNYRKYDRVYCGARVFDEEIRDSLKNLLTMKGILIYPYGENVCVFLYIFFSSVLHVSVCLHLCMSVYAYHVCVCVCFCRER